MCIVHSESLCSGSEAPVYDTPVNNTTGLEMGNNVAYGQMTGRPPQQTQGAKYDTIV